MSAQYKFEAIGTGWTIDIDEPISEDKESSLLKLIRSRIDIFDKDYSRFRDDSLVTEISHHAGTYTMPEDFKPMIDLYRGMYNATSGLMTPLIGRLISDAGYDKDYSLGEKGSLQSPPDWDSVLQYDHPKLIVKEPVLLDFGAAGKGYLIDIVSRVIEESGIKGYSIDAGGDILHRGKSAVRIGLENPSNTDQAIGVVKLANRSICGSSGNRRAWGRFHHIINPKTITSPTEIISIWVIADSTILADALTTALFFVEPSDLSEYKFEYLILNKDFSIIKSAGFPGELFTV
ncbi:MAG: FAD:protein FMN transferase [bacterium]